MQPHYVCMSKCIRNKLVHYSTYYRLDNHRVNRLKNTAYKHLGFQQDSWFRQYEMQWKTLGIYPADYQDQQLAYNLEEKTDNYHFQTKISKLFSNLGFCAFAIIKNFIHSFIALNVS